MDNFSVRLLTPKDWEQFRAIRLEALKLENDKFSSSLRDQKNLFKAQWRELCRPTRSKAIIGLFDDDKLIGITASIPWKERPGTAYIGWSYIQRQYRKKHLGGLLYGARREWLVRHSRYSMATVNHREGNKPSERNNRAQGAHYWRRELNHRWPDRSLANKVWYLMPLYRHRPTPKVLSA